MATLVSPGVSISVQNESFYSASGPGTVPLVIFATAQDKLVPGSSSIVAEGTRKATAGKMYLMTSQRDVLQTFGVPVFQSKNGTVVQGDELNEYGLHALFSAMGVTNRAYALRADIDLNALQPTSVMPKNEPLNQTMWFDVASSDFGVFEHNGGQSPNKILNWTKKNVLVLSPEQILSKLWDCDEKYIDNNTLTVYIRRLRTKVEKDASHPEYIKTVHGMGYLWEERK